VFDDASTEGGVMLALRLPLVALVLALAATSCSALKAEESPSATVVLFDMSKSTRDPAVRDRYDRTFSMVLSYLRDAGGVMGADVIHDNPLVHGSLPIDVAFDTCGLADNTLDCRKALEAESKTAIAKAGAILEHQSQGTDIFGALELPAEFYEAYPATPTARWSSCRTWSSLRTGCISARWRSGRRGRSIGSSPRRRTSISRVCASMWSGRARPASSG
jgi:hypothetical protein